MLSEYTQRIAILFSISAVFHILLKFEAPEVRYTLVKLKGSGGDLVTSPPLNRKVGCSRPTMFRPCCLRAKQHYPAQQINLNKCMLFLRRGSIAVLRDELYSSYVGPFSRGYIVSTVELINESGEKVIK